MQVFAPMTWGALVLLLLRRFMQSPIAYMPVSELLRGNTDIAAFLDREHEKRMAEEGQRREAWDLLVQDSERLTARMRAGGH